MSANLAVLLPLAASVGFIHTVMGPDHYLPFIALSKARRWGTKKTFFVTLLCGLGHIPSSAILGFIGLALGIALSRLESLEGLLGAIASWFLIAFGLVYGIWGMKSASKHRGEGAHSAHGKTRKELTPWILFLIFGFGPCEPLIPILMYPAAEGSLMAVFLTIAVFGGVTVFTMEAIVMIALTGAKLVKFEFLEKYGHGLAGLMICASGLAIKIFGV